VVLDDLSQGVAVVDVLDPVRQLRVPQQGVAADELAVGLGKVDNLVGVGKVELVAGRYSNASHGLVVDSQSPLEGWIMAQEQKLTFDGIPLHAVLSRNLSKVALDDVDQGIVVEMVVVDLGAEVRLPLGLELVVQASCSCCSLTAGGRSRRTDRGLGFSRSRCC
jgi:hypothetical protein